MKKKLNKKERKEYLKDLLIVTKEFLLGRNLEFKTHSEKSDIGENIYFIGVVPNQIGIFGLDKDGKFYGVVAISSLFNYKIKEGYKQLEIDENEKIWTKFDTQEEFLNYICKPQVELIKNEN